jgi:hypothetical protein
VAANVETLIRNGKFEQATTILRDEIDDRKAALAFLVGPPSGANCRKCGEFNVPGPTKKVRAQQALRVLNTTEWRVGASCKDNEESLRAHLAKWIPGAVFVSVTFEVHRKF